jgi:hypothetical protein
MQSFWYLINIIKADNYVAHIYKTLLENPEGKRPLGTPRSSRSKDNIKSVLKK